MTTTRVQENLRELMGRVEGLNPTRLAKETGVAQSTIWRVLEGKIKDPGTEVLAPLAARFKITVAQLRGDVPIDRKVMEEVPAYGAVVTLRVYDVQASMGVGRLPNEHDTVVGSMQVSQEWLRRNVPGVTSAKELAVITAYGDSMEPTFRDGDILLVDRGVVEVKIDAIYVLARDAELFVKRLQRKMNNTLIIKSDNPVFDPETLTEKDLERVRVLGRVVYAWNGKRL